MFGYNVTDPIYIDFSPVVTKRSITRGPLICKDIKSINRLILPYGMDLLE